MGNRPATLRPASELAASRQHGDRLRYMAGCRCAECRRANTQYERTRAAARKAGDWNGLVPAERARQHVAALSAAGVGRRQVADAARIAESVLVKIINGERTKIRALTERALLAVTQQAAADHALIDAGPTWALLEELLAQGYTKAHLARELGYERAAIQLARTQITVRNAYDVKRLHERLRRVPAREAQRLLASLRAEGYRPERIAALASACAARNGLPAPDLQVHDGLISAAAADVLKRLHSEITEVPEEEGSV